MLDIIGVIFVVLILVMWLSKGDSNSLNFEDWHKNMPIWARFLLLIGALAFMIGLFALMAHFNVSTPADTGLWPE